MYLRPFDPWKSELCTCPSKYSLNPYTGCTHGCIYCYASSYIKDFFLCRVKPNLVESLMRELKKIPSLPVGRQANSLISLSNTSDPYPPMEVELKITRKCLESFKVYGIRVLIITKSNIVCRDRDLLKEMKSAVTVTITTFKHYKKLEPYAPSPFKRLEAMEKLSKDGIPTGLRLDPIIPMLNESEVEEILKSAKDCGVKHVTASTFKPRWDSWERISKVFPDIAEKIKRLYFKEGTKISNSWYLSKNIRKDLMVKVRQICDALSLTFSSCREGFVELNTSSSCDGSHLITERNSFQAQESTDF